MVSSLKKLFQLCDDNFFIFLEKKGLEIKYCYTILMETNKKIPKNPKIFICKNCEYYTVSKKDYEKHILTLKHKRLTNANKNPEKSQECKIFLCNCGKEYKHMSSLSKHKKTCNYAEIENNVENFENTENNIDKDLVMMLIKQNSELLEVIKNGTHNINSNNINSNNKAFNLNFFLNETCKDAMNITDFVESIQLQLSDLERVGEVGYVEGISSIIIKNLNGLDITQRPVHCTDKKRETIYVKDDNKWEKDDENTKMHKLVKKVQDKNFRMIKKFKEKYPDYHKPSSKQSDVYNNIIIESMGGRGDNDYEKEEKIIRKISNVTTIDKLQ